MPRSFLVKKKHRNGYGKVLPEDAAGPPRIHSFETTSSSARLDAMWVDDFGGYGQTGGGESLDSEAEFIVVSSTSDDRLTGQQMSPRPAEDRIGRDRESESVKDSTSEECELEEEEEEDEEEEEEVEEEEKRNKAIINECQYNQGIYDRGMRSESISKSFLLSFGTDRRNLDLHTAEAARISLLLARNTTSNFPLAPMPLPDAANTQNNYCSGNLWHRQEQYDTRGYYSSVPDWSDLSQHGVLRYPVALRRRGDIHGAVFPSGRYPAWVETGATAAPTTGCESRRQPFLSPVGSDSNTSSLPAPMDDAPTSPTPLLVPMLGSITPNFVSSCSSPSPPLISHLYSNNPARCQVQAVTPHGSPRPKLGFSVPEILWGREEHRKSLAPDSTSILNDCPRPETNPFECATCRKTYSTFNGLTKHQRAAHCASKQTLASVLHRLECPRCERVYTTVGALKMHIRTHTLPCHCPVCGKAFSRPWLLQGHMRTHTGERPFECPHCARAFADRSNLRAHLQTHSDVKRYSCRRCGKTFSRMSLLIKHSENICSSA